MYYPQVRFIRTAIPMSLAKLADLWGSLRQVFLLPEFETFQSGDDALVTWLQQTSANRVNDSLRTPKFRRVIGAEGIAREIVTGVSERVIRISEVNGGKYITEIDFKSGSVFCAAKVLAWFPAGLRVEIDVVDGNRYYQIEWETAEPSPPALLVDRNAKPPSQLDNEKAAHMIWEWDNTLADQQALLALA